MTWIDRMNPILVKEVRQALRGKQFRWGVLALLVGGCLVAISVAASAGPEGVQAPRGSDVFLWYLGFLCFLGMVAVPNAAANALSQEMQERTIELVAITSLTPAAIVRGKILSALVQSGLYVSALAPFLALTYFLRGIDLLTILSLLVLAFGAMVFLTLFSLMTAVCMRTAAVRRLGSAFLALLLVGAMAACIALAGAWIRFNAVSLCLQALWAGRPEVWLGTGIVLFLSATYAALCFVGASAGLSFQSANRSMPTRVVLAVQWAGWTAFMISIYLVSGFSTRVWEPAMVLAYALPAFIQLFLFGVNLSAEPDLLSRRVYAAYRRKTGPRRFLADLFYPGGARGFRFTVVLFVATLVVSIAALFLATGGRRRFGLLTGTWPVSELLPHLAAVFAACCYGLLFLAGPLALFRRLPARWQPSPKIVRASTLLAVAVGCMVSMFSLMAEDRATWSLWTLSNPFWTVHEWWTDWLHIDLWIRILSLWLLGGGAAVAVALQLRPVSRGLAAAPDPGPSAAPAGPLGAPVHG